MSVIPWLKSKWAVNIDCKDEEELARITQQRKYFFGRVMFDLANNGVRLTIGFFGAVVVAALLLRTLQGTSLLDAFYWGIVTVFTVGYGDVLPTTDATKVVTMLFIPVSAILLAFLIAYAVRLGSYSSDRDTHKEQELRELHIAYALAEAQLSREIREGLFHFAGDHRAEEARLAQIVEFNHHRFCAMIEARDAENASKVKAAA